MPNRDIAREIDIWRRTCATSYSPVGATDRASHDSRGVTSGALGRRVDLGLDPPGACGQAPGDGE